MVVLDGPPLGDSLTATDLSADGAFIPTRGEVAPLDFGTSLQLSLELPTDPTRIHLSAHVMRQSPAGFGVRFGEMSARDRSRLRNYTGYYEMDEAIVRLQQVLGEVLTGNLLPLGQPDEVRSILERAAEKGHEITAVPGGIGFKPILCKIRRIFDRADGFVDGSLIELDHLIDPLSARVRVLYLAFAESPLRYALEGIVVSGGERPHLLLPERLYLTERRSLTRDLSAEASCSFPAVLAGGERQKFPLSDLSDGGASIRVPLETLVFRGTRLPAFELQVDGSSRTISGATVRWVRRAGQGGLRIGLRFETFESRDRETFKEIKRPSVERGIRKTIVRSVSLLGGKVAGFLRRPDRRYAEGVEVVRYRNRKGDTVAAIIDANFNTAGGDVRPDVAIVIAPAILKRKEIFGLLARTVIDDLNRDDIKVVTLRFDASYVVGESTMDAELAAQGRPYYNWTLDHMKADIEASLRYLEDRFRPRSRTLVTLSLSAIPGRKVVVESRHPKVDLWIAPYGCPDAQDMFRNYLAGLDLFEQVRETGQPETILIHGRPISSARLYGSAEATGMAFLEQGRKDLSKIDIPVTWILGSYDHWVTRTRVKSMLEAPGGGPREIFEFATGHVLKNGPEAIEVFKLVSESISKHLFKSDRPAAEPNLARFAVQSAAEWARVKRQKLEDAAGFWERHLFGDGEDEFAYDIMLEHPSYPHFLARQAELLDVQPGDDIADFGCGTGNFTLSILDSYKSDDVPRSITFVDLVPSALEATRKKVDALFDARRLQHPLIKGVLADLEVSRLAVITEFLSGELYAVEELVNRVEGLSQHLAHKLTDHYGRELHAILRGLPSSSQRVLELCPSLDSREISIVLELSRVARFACGDTLLADLKPGIQQPRTALDLLLEHLNFGAATKNFQLDIDCESFDRLGASLLISYLYDPLSTMKEFFRLLRPGGTLVVSTILPNFDASKLYKEEVEILQDAITSGDPWAEAKLSALRRFCNMVSQLIELEEDGRFHFFDPEGLKNLALEAGFTNPNVFLGFGNPPTAAIVRASKPL